MRSRIGLFLGAAALAVCSNSVHAVYWTEVDGKISAYITNDNNRSFDTAVHEAMFTDQAGTTLRTFGDAVGHLVTIDNAAENHLVAGLGRNRGTRWIGLTNSPTHGGTPLNPNQNTSGLAYPNPGETPASQAGIQRGEGHVWVDGSPVFFQNWGGGEPNNSLTEPYAEIRQDHLWNDIASNAGVNYAAAGNLRRSIIEFNPTTAPLSKWEVTTYKARDVADAGFNVNNLAQANALRNSAAGSTNRQLTFGTQGVATGTSALANFSDSGPTGNFLGDALPPGLAGANDDYVLIYKNSFSLGADTALTFGFRSDDGGSIRITGTSPVAFGTTTNANGQVAGSDTLSFAATRGPADTFGQVTLLAGTYNIEFTWFEDGGATASGEAFFAPGSFTTFAGNGFTLLGDNSGGVLNFTNAANNVEVHKGRPQVNDPDITSLAIADSVINGSFPLIDLDPTQPGNNPLTGFTNVVNFRDVDAATGGGGNFGTGSSLLNDVPLGAGNMDDFVIRATGLVQITEGGVWTFGANGDDGFRLRLDLDGDGIYETTVLSRDGTGGEINVFGNIALVEGIYGIEYIGYDRSSGFGSELFAALNPTGVAITAFSQLPFQLVGDAENGGLRVAQDLQAFAVPEPATAMLGLFGLAALARRRNRSA